MTVDINQADKRKSPRIDLALVATIKPLDGAKPFSCLVSNMSENGAKLLVENAYRIPSTFSLYLEHENCSPDCVVVWRSDSEVGVIFESAPTW